MIKTCMTSVILLALVPLATAQQSRAFYDVPVVQLTGEQPPFEGLLDFDADGYLDAVGMVRNSTVTQIKLALYRNDGTGALTETWTDTSPAGAGALYALDARLATGDLNGDGLEDFALVDGNELRFYTSQPGGTPFLQVHDEGQYLYDVALHDFDGDGRDEVVALAYPHLLVFWSSGAIARYPSHTQLYNPYKLQIAEISGDSVDDILIVGYRSVYLYYWNGSAFSHWGTLWHELNQGYEETAVTAGDIDGDQDTDVVVFETNSALQVNYQVFRRVQPNAWSREAKQPGPPGERLVDLDQDGDLDAIHYRASWSSSSQAFPRNERLGWMFLGYNDGTGHFETAQLLNFLGARHLAGAADLDLDGDVDLVAGRSVYHARGAIEQSPTPQQAQYAYTANELNDLELDGDIDLGPVLDRVERNRGDGSFEPGTPLLLDQTSGVAYEGPGFPGDFTGDGAVDLIVRSRVSGAVEGMRLLGNDGGGGLHDLGLAGPAGVDFSIDSLEPQDALAADADGDGDLDLVTRASTLSSWPITQSALWWNGGAGIFSQNMLAFPDERILWIGRLDPDPWPDLIVAYSTVVLPRLFAVSVAVRPGTGTGSFAPRQHVYGGFPGAGGPTAIEMADIDGDGRLDMSLIGVGPPGIYLNTSTTGGTVSFQHLALGPFPGSRMTDPAAAMDIYPRDVDGDGALDLLVSSRSSGGTDVLLRIPGTPFGTSGFAHAATLAIPAGLPVDADGDGDQDVLGWYLVRNTLHEGAAAGALLQYGAGTAGTGGVVPTLGGSGPLRSGETAELRLRGARGGAPFLLALGTQRAAVPGFPAPGITFLVGGAPLLVAARATGSSGSTGEGAFTLSYPVDTAFAGAQVYAQVLVVDVAAPFTFAASNGLALTFGI